jgi:hypothetical protein
MAILQGSSYKLPVVIRSPKGEVITADMVQRASFTFADITKLYGDGGEVIFDYDTNEWIVPLTEEETFNLNKETIKWQARFLFIDGSIDGTYSKSEDVYSSIDQTRFTAGGGENA